MRKRFTQDSERKVAAGSLAADWMAARCQAEFRSAAIFTIGRMAHRRRGADLNWVQLNPGQDGLAEIHGIAAPKPARCRAAVTVWLDTPAPSRRNAALAALAA